MRAPRPLAALAVIGTLVVLAALALGLLAPSGDGAGPTEGGAAEAERETPPDVAAPRGLATPSGRSVRSSELSLEDEAKRTLELWRGQGGCVVARSGYLDLSGKVWGCVLQGQGWAEVVVIWEGASGSGSEVLSLRMEASELEGVLGRALGSQP